MKNKIIIIFGFVFIVSSNAFADTGSKIDGWFSDMNYSNVTNPGIYEGQGARYATLGGISARAPIQSLNIINVQTPKASAGCGGIDLYAGGFSAIDANQFVNNLKAIGQNAKSLVFMLAIQIVSPQLSKEMERIQNWANHYLNVGMDSCEAAQKLVGGALDLAGAKSGNCTVKRMNDFGETWTVANNKCTTGGEAHSTVATDPNYIEFVKGNLAWNVLMTDPMFQADLDFAQLVMNLTGTVIVGDASSDDDSGSTLNRIPIALNDERYDQIKIAVLYGSQAVDNLSLYKCTGAVSNSKESCTSITSTPQLINPSWTGLRVRIDAMVENIVAKIYSDTPLSAEEQGLVGTTRLPLYRYLIAAAAVNPRGSNISGFTKQYTQLIADDIVLRQFDKIVTRVEHGTYNDLRIQDSKRIVAYREEIKKLREHIRSEMDKTTDDMTKFFVMKNEIQMYEKSMMSRLSAGMVTSSLWGG